MHTKIRIYSGEEAKRRAAGMAEWQGRMLQGKRSGNRQAVALFVLLLAVFGMAAIVLLAVLCGGL